MNKLFPAIAAAVLLLATPHQARANPYLAVMACMDADVMDPSPRRLGQTSSGVTLYVCRDMLSGPPFPVVGCYGYGQCRVLYYTY